MRREIFYYIFIFLLLCNVVLSEAQNQRNNPADITQDSFEEVLGTGLVIRTNPAAARVFIDGVERGLSPIILDSLLPGEYLIRLSREGFVEKEFTVTLFSTSRLIASIRLERPQGLVEISVSKDPESPENLPFNPVITVNSRFNTDALELIDNTAKITLPLGRHVIRARARGFEDVTLTITITEEHTPIKIIMNPLN